MSIPFTVLGHGCTDLWNSRLGRHGGGPPALGNSWGSSPCLPSVPAFSTSQQVCGVFHLLHTSPLRWRRTPTRAGRTEWGPRLCLCLCSGLRLLPWTRFSAPDIFSDLACSLIFLPFSAQKHLWVPGDVPREATLYMAPDLTAGGWNFLLSFGPACSNPGKGFSPHGFLPPLHAPAFLFSPCKHDYWE